RGDAGPRTKPLMWNRPPDRPGPNGEFPDLAILEGDWKLLVERDGSNPQLYRIAADPAESNNVCATHPEIVTRLMEDVRTWDRDIARDRRTRRNAATPSQTTPPQ